MNNKSANRQMHKQSQHRLKPGYAAVLLAFAVQTAQANPIGGSVVNGQANFSTTGNTLTVTNTPGTIINWQGFSINTNETTRFAQQSASSAVLNRVVGSDPSSILGTLQSNGRVFLINPNGILFGAGAVVDVAGLVASTLNLSDADFLAGNSHFTAVPGAGNISNAGNITAHGDGQSGGQIFLIAPNVENTGVITAPNGEILLAAGYSVDLANTNNPNLRVNITAPAGDATNVGKLIASSGSLGLFGTVVRNSGTVNADSATMQGGKIVFKASQLAEVGGTVSATGTTGGTVQVLGNQVAVLGNIDASGTNGGGTVLIGGDAHGANPDVQNAQYTYVDGNAIIKADASQTGNGGKVVVWADKVTQFNGYISAKGGAQSGNGGWVETSGKQTLGFAGLVDTTAAHGMTGSLLLDPTDITIGVAANTGTMLWNGTTTFLDTAATPSNLNVTTLQTQLNLTNVTVDTTSTLLGTGNITVQNPIAWVSANSLTLKATGLGAITTNPGATITNTGTGGLTMQTAGGWITLGANVQLTGAFTANAGATGGVMIGAAVNTGAGAINLTAGSSITEGGAAATLTTSSLLTTSSAGGTTLTNANMVGSFNANNSTSGNIVFFNNGAFSVGVPGVINTAAGGSIALADTAANTMLSNPSGQINTNNGAITLTADKMNLFLSTGTINAGSGNVILQNFTATNAINIGSLVDTTASTLELSQSELSTITTTGLLTIGNAANSGAITVSAPISLTNNTALVNGVGGIAINGAITATGLTLNTTGVGTQTAAAITASGNLTLGGGTFNMTSNITAASVINNAIFNWNGGVLSAPLVNNGTATFSVTGTTYSNVYSGTGALTLAPSGGSFHFFPTLTAGYIFPSVTYTNLGNLFFDTSATITNLTLNGSTFTGAGAITIPNGGVLTGGATLLGG
jgi:filamentous hemagglutinin family protein